MKPLECWKCHSSQLSEVNPGTFFIMHYIREENDVSVYTSILKVKCDDCKEEFFCDSTQWQEFVSCYL